uniref:Uncharacterized protein n=1 Tax=Strongyloides papillosus TaxID=174720 RepID=A0A0N5BDS4_STREA
MKHLFNLRNFKNITPILEFLRLNKCFITS